MKIKRFVAGVSPLVVEAMRVRQGAKREAAALLRLPPRSSPAYAGSAVHGTLVGW